MPSTFALKIVLKRGVVNQRYATEEEAEKALTDLDLTNTTPGFAKTGDGKIVVNRAEVVSANIEEIHPPVIM
jgi:hypothetical protein